MADGGGRKYEGTPPILTQASQITRKPPSTTITDHVRVMQPSSSFPPQDAQLLEALANAPRVMAEFRSVARVERARTRHIDRDSRDDTTRIRRHDDDAIRQ